MEYENTHAASKGVAGAGLGLGIAGTALGILSGGLNGIGLFNGGAHNGVCHEDHFVNRYEIGLQQEIAAKDSKIGLLESNIYTDSKIADVYERLNAKVGAIEAQLCEQRVYNATMNSTVGCIQAQVAQLASLTKTVIPIANVCPAPMPQYNSWTAPTATTTTA